MKYSTITEGGGDGYSTPHIGLVTISLQCLLNPITLFRGTYEDTPELLQKGNVVAIMRETEVGV